MRGSFDSKTKLDDNLADLVMVSLETGVLENEGASDGLLENQAHSTTEVTASTKGGELNDE